jgi:hypothetical protein
VILTRRGLFTVTYEIRTGDTIRVAYLAPSDPGEEIFRVIYVGLSLVAEAIDFLVFDPVRHEPDGQGIQRSGLIGIEYCPRRDPPAGECESLAPLEKRLTPTDVA